MRKKYSLIVMVPFLGALSVGTANATPAEMRVDEINMTQQSGTCTGVVKDANGEVAIGASVVVKGTTNGVITDMDGNFTLSGVKQGDIIVVSYIGLHHKKLNGQENLCKSLCKKTLKRWMK